MNITSKAWWRGAMKSWTISTSTVIMFLGYLQSQTDYLAQLFTRRQMGFVMLGIGVLMFVLRARTTESLADKGTPSGS
jgi:hypothetical protein